MALSTPPPGGGQRNDYYLILQKMKELENICATLREENESLKHELNSVKTKNTRASEEVERSIQYHTDEDELENETNWLLNKSRRPQKKRRMETSPEIILDTSKTKTKESHELRPPPIILTQTGITHQYIQKIIKETIQKDFFLKLIAKDNYKINLFDSLDYRALTKKLTTLKLAWHSYESKQTRQIRVIVKDLHHTCEPAEIVADLVNQGLKATNAFRKLKWKTKEPLNMFILCFDSNEDIKKIYEIKQILNCIIKIEQLKPSKLIPQCKSCQGFMHTKNYCCKPPKCVKCAGDHETIKCTKQDNELPKCCNCGQNHPASYRGCQVAKDLQKLRNKNIAGRKSLTAANPI